MSARLLFHHGVPDEAASVTSLHVGAPWVMEDLPVGAIGTFTLTKLRTEDNHKSLASRRITIESGSGVQLVEW